jgi:preprotein translocase subunit SecG
MHTLIVIIHLLVSFFLIFVVLLQTGKGAQMGATFGGSSQTMFGATGGANLLQKLTTGSAIVFMCTSLILSVYSGAQKSVIKDDKSVVAPTKSAPITKDAPKTETAPAKDKLPAEKPTESTLPGLPDSNATTEIPVKIDAQPKKDEMTTSTPTTVEADPKKDEKAVTAPPTTEKPKSNVTNSESKDKSETQR